MAANLRVLWPHSLYDEASGSASQKVAIITAAVTPAAAMEFPPVRIHHLQHNTLLIWLTHRLWLCRPQGTQPWSWWLGTGLSLAPRKVAAGQAGQNRSRRDRGFVGWQDKPFGDNVMAVALESCTCLFWSCPSHHSRAHKSTFPQHRTFLCPVASNLICWWLCQSSARRAVRSLVLIKPQGLNPRP